MTTVVLTSGCERGREAADPDVSVVVLNLCHSDSFLSFLHFPRLARSIFIVRTKRIKEMMPRDSRDLLRGPRQAGPVPADQSTCRRDIASCSG